MCKYLESYAGCKVYNFQNIYTISDSLEELSRYPELAFLTIWMICVYTH